MASQRLIAIRELFSRANLVGSKPLAAYFLPRTDYHNSEYLASHDERVAFLSGFTGTKATVIITQNEALLWTDGRYFLQATEELEKGWSLMKQREEDVPEPSEWLLQNLNDDDVIGFDSHLFGHAEAQGFIKKMRLGGLKTASIPLNLVDELWTERPKPLIKPLIALRDDEVGESGDSKLDRVRKEIAKKKCSAVLISDLAEVAWLTNCRNTADIPFNPVFFAVAFITADDAHLFIDERKLEDADGALKKHLRSYTIHSYDDILKFLEGFHKEQMQKKGRSHKVYVPDSSNYAWGNVFDEEHAHVGLSPVRQMKAIKNVAELSGMRDCHIRDAAALVQFFRYLEIEVAQNGRKITEQQAAAKVLELRSRVRDFVSESFETISAVGEHAALPHYHMSEESGKTPLTTSTVYLCDSGAQYRDGTTDVTRTVHFGTPSAEEKRMNTLVLKGHISNANTPVPIGLQGARLDAFARQALWRFGYEFGHGVGHGIGHFLNVHEMPPSIGNREAIPDNGLRVGMIVTIEPGYYAAKKFGIRIENDYELVKTDVESAASNFLRFEPLTWVPIQKALIDKTLLDADELDWFNKYHAKCVEKTGAYMKAQGLNEDYAWLVEQCKAL